MNTQTKQPRKSYFVHYPAPENDPLRGGYTTIRNTTASIEKYIRAVAPRTAALADEIVERRPELSERTWLAALHVVQNNVQIDQRTECRRHGTILHNARVVQDEIFTTTVDARYPLRCTCEDADEKTGSAPTAARAVRACEHVIAYIIFLELEWRT